MTEYSEYSRILVLYIILCTSERNRKMKYARQQRILELIEEFDIDKASVQLGINDMDDDDRKKLDVDTLQKHQTIVSVLSKAQIRGFLCADHKQRAISHDNFVFANPCCMQFDYVEMQKYVAGKYDDYRDNYRKAYYLAKLYRFKESYELFVTVATEAYIANDYLLQHELFLFQFF